VAAAAAAAVVVVLLLAAAILVVLLYLFLYVICISRIQKKEPRGFRTASELYRLSDLRFSTKFVSTSDGQASRGQREASPRPFISVF
jgi:hypothetical protein